MSIKEALELQDTILLRAVGPEAVAQLARLGRKRTLSLGGLVCASGEPDAPIVFVLAGVLRVYEADADGREQTLDIASAGQALNLPLAFDGDGAAPASIQVWSDQATWVQLPASAFAAVVSHDPALAAAVLHALAVRARHLSVLAADLSLRSVRQRLARFLLNQLEGAPDQAPVRWTHAEIASRLGTAREVVSRQLRELVREGVITQERQRLVVADLAALREIAES